MIMWIRVRTHVERVVDQVLRYTSDHIQTGQDVLHVVMNVGLYHSQHMSDRKERQTHKVNLRLVAHVSLHLLVGVDVLPQRQDTVQVISAQAVDDGLDWLQCTLVEDEITLQNVHCIQPVSWSFAIS